MRRGSWSASYPATPGQLRGRKFETAKSSHERADRPDRSETPRRENVRLATCSLLLAERRILVVSIFETFHQRRTDRDANVPGEQGSPAAAAARLLSASVDADGVLYRASYALQRCDDVFGLRTPSKNAQCSRLLAFCAPRTPDLRVRLAVSAVRPRPSFRGVSSMRPGPTSISEALGPCLSWTVPRTDRLLLPAKRFELRRGRQTRSRRRFVARRAGVQSQATLAQIPYRCLHRMSQFELGRPKEG